MFGFVSFDEIKEELSFKVLPGKTYWDMVMMALPYFFNCDMYTYIKDMYEKYKIDLEWEMLSDSNEDGEFYAGLRIVNFLGEDILKECIHDGDDPGFDGDYHLNKSAVLFCKERGERGPTSRWRISLGDLMNDIVCLAAACQNVLDGHKD